MARGITEQDVLLAADALLARGERPTIERVRHELGRGSPNTVNRHLEAWWSTLAQRIEGRDGSALPASLLELCSRLYAGVCEQAQLEAKAELSEGKEILKAEQAQLAALREAIAREKAEVAVADERLASEMSALRTRIEVLASEKAHLQTEINRFGALARKAEEAAQADRSTLEKARGQHHAEIQRVRAQWEGNESRWLKEIDHLRDEAKRLRAQGSTEIRSLREQVNSAERSRMASARDLEALRQEILRNGAQLLKERESRLQAEAARDATRELLDRFRTMSDVPKSKRSSKRTNLPSTCKPVPRDGLKGAQAV